jgi:hypothetical protein
VTTEIVHDLIRQLSPRLGWARDDDGWHSTGAKMSVTMAVSVHLRGRKPTDGGRTLIFADAESLLAWLDKHEFGHEFWQPNGPPTIYLASL